jgi:hypothetical protein
MLYGSSVTSGAISLSREEGMGQGSSDVEVASARYGKFPSLGGRKLSWPHRAFASVTEKCHESRRRVVPRPKFVHPSQHRF